jgi:peptidoglycan hydrolase CwlO-like protein
MATRSCCSLENVNQMFYVRTYIITNHNLVTFSVELYIITFVELLNLTYTKTKRGMTFMGLAFSQIVTGTVTAITAGAITLGAMTYWNGEDTVNEAKATLQDQGNKIELYEMNETQLVNKIVELKDLRDSLKDHIAELEAKGISDQATIDDLNDQIDAANVEINNLEKQLGTAETNGDILAQRILDLEGQLNKANEDIAGLQEQLDETNNQTSTAEPLTDTEMADILESSTEETVQ